MYSKRSGLTLGFHGCDQSVVEKVVSGKEPLGLSKNTWDWLGHGIYFWDYSPSRALEFAQERVNKPTTEKPIKSPAVIGAVLELGYCLDLLDFRNLQFLKESYDMLIASYKASGKPLPTNTSKRSDVKNELFSRKLDCAVIQILHETRREEGLEPYDSVRGVFWEGPELYPKAGFREKDHIQICIRNPNCIKGYFLPRELDEDWQAKLV